MDLLQVSGRLHAKNGRAFVWVGLYPLLGQHEAQELTYNYTKSTFGGVKSHVVSSYLSEYLLEVSDVVSRGRRPDNHVFYVHVHASSNLFGEDLIHQMLICGPRVLKPKWHHVVTITSQVSYKGGFLPVGQMHGYLVVP